MTSFMIANFQRCPLFLLLPWQTRLLHFCGRVAQNYVFQGSSHARLDLVLLVESLCAQIKDCLTKETLYTVFI